MVDWLKATKKAVATVNKGTVDGGLDKNVELLEIEALHTKINKNPLIIIIEPANLSINNDIRIGMNEKQGGFYGRAEGLAVYTNTRRTLSIDFTLIRSEVLNGVEAVSNNALTVNLLQQILYPSYLKTGYQNTSVIKTPPYFKIKYGDLIGNFKNGQRQGLTGYFTHLDINMRGRYGGGGIGDNIGIGSGGVKIPIEYSITMRFNVLHDHLVGWYDGQFAGDGRLNWPLNTGIPSNNTAGGPGGEGGNSTSPKPETAVPGAPGTVVGESGQKKLMPPPKKEKKAP